MALSWEKVVVIVIIVVTVLLIILVNQNTFEEMTKSVGEVIVKVTSQVDIGSEELQGERPTITPEQKESIDNLIYYMKGLAGNGKENCVSNYNGLVPMEGASVSFSQKNESVDITISDKIGRFVESQKIEDLQLCVIAGRFIPYNFQNKFLEKDDPGVMEYYTPLNNFILKYDGENQVLYSGTSSDLKDGGWLFKVKDNIVCMMPSSYWTSDKGLNDKYLTNSNEGLYVGNKLPECS